MAKLPLSNKHLQISKASTVTTTVLAVASFIVVASLVGSRALLQQRSYQAKIIAGKEEAVKTLEANIAAVDLLTNSYKEFTSRPDNIIGGLSAGTGERDGDNAKIILDALPGSYDFPALVSSVEKMVLQNGVALTAITGTDDELVQGAKETEVPEVVEIPFTFTVDGDYDSFYGLIETMERSIRPIQITTLSLKLVQDNDSMDVAAKTFYQSEKKLNITTKVVQ